MRAVDRQKNIAQAKDSVTYLKICQGNPSAWEKILSLQIFFFFLQADIKGLVLHSLVSLSSLK